MNALALAFATINLTLVGLCIWFFAESPWHVLALLAIAFFTIRLAEISRYHT